MAIEQCTQLATGSRQLGATSAEYITKTTKKWLPPIHERVSLTLSRSGTIKPPTPPKPMGFLTAEKIENVKSNRSSGAYFHTKTIQENGDGTKMRFLGDAISGVGGWRDNKPLRFEVRPDAEEFDVDTLDIDYSGNPGRLRDFVASVIWNYDEKALQIFEITQVTIQDKLFGLHKNAEWGDLTQYDIVLKKVKKGDRIDYEVVPSPKGMGKLDKDIEKAFDETPIDLTKLYTNEDPFKPGQ